MRDMVYEPMGTMPRPSDWFDYYETALRYLCDGCPNADGACANALAIQDDAPGSIRRVDGRMRCAVRPPDPEPEGTGADPGQMRLFGEGE